jgi:hypothetical protein
VAQINPALPTIGGARGDGETNLRADTVALLNEFNGNIDAANMKANSLTGAEMAVGGFPFPYRTIVERSGLATVAGVLCLPARTNAAAPNPSVVTVAFPFDPADYVVAGRTTRLRIRAATTANGTAPGGTVAVGMGTFTVTVGGLGSGNAVNVVTGISGAGTGNMTPLTGGTITQIVGTDFAPPVAGYYLLYAFVSALAANSVLDIHASLQVHWI